MIKWKKEQTTPAILYQSRKDIVDLKFFFSCKIAILNRETYQKIKEGRGVQENKTSMSKQIITLMSRVGLRIVAEVWVVVFKLKNTLGQDENWSKQVMKQLSIKNLIHKIKVFLKYHYHFHYYYWRYCIFTNPYLNFKMPIIHPTKGIFVLAHTYNHTKCKTHKNRDTLTHTCLHDYIYN